MSILVFAVPAFILIAIFFPSTRIIILLYVTWIFLDRRVVTTGRNTPGFKRWYWSLPIWNGFAAYFPAKLVKTHELDPSKKYIFGFGPHGLYGLSLISTIYGLHQWDQLFPGIDVIGITLPINFWVPIWRDIILCLGVGDSSAASIRYRLNNGNPGTSMVIAVGGQREFRSMKPGCLDLVIKSRKGFVKIALQTGCSLVPIISFGENDLYCPLENKLIKNILNGLFYSLFRASAPLVFGRFGSMFPHKHPIYVVVGKPIEINEKIVDPTQKDIDDTHAKYLKSLRELYDDHKDEFHSYRSHDMQFL